MVAQGEAGNLMNRYIYQAENRIKHLEDLLFSGKGAKDCDIGTEALYQAEKWLEGEDEKNLREAENKLLGSLKACEFNGDLWSLHLYDTLRWVFSEGFKKGSKL